MDAQHVLARNNVKVSGGGDATLLFAHGMGCDQSMWRFVAPAFEERYRVVQFDYVGAGQSERGAYCSTRYASLDGYAQDILDICDALALRDVCLIGHAVSGMTGLLAAIREPQRFSRLVFVAASPRYINDSGYTGGFDHSDIVALLDLLDHNFAGFASMLAATAMQNPERPDLCQDLEGRLCAYDPKMLRQLAEVTFFSDYREHLKQLTVPSLILQCADDLVAPLEVGDFMHRNLRNSTLARMQATGHCPHVSHPQETTRLISEYLISAGHG